MAASSNLPNSEKRFNAVLQNRQFEIDLFWKRSLFFWGFIGAAFVGIGALKYEQPALSLLVSSFGFVCSLCWTLANRGSKFWQEQWESKIENVEADVTGPLFQKIEPTQRKGWLGGQRYSVSKLAILISDYVSVIWLFIFIRQSCLSFGMTNFTRYRAPAAVFIVFLTVIYSFSAVWKSKSTLPSPAPNSSPSGSQDQSPQLPD